MVKYQIFFVPLRRFSETRSEERKKMSTFIGHIAGRVDEKGRIFVPATYRKLLSGLDSKRIVMHRDMDNECIIFYPEHIWDEKVTALRNALDDWEPEDQMLLMQFMSAAEFLEMDNQGRILIQKRDLEAIGIGQDIVFVGLFDRFALWSPDKFEEKKLESRDLSDRIRARMKRG